jgi:pimeloyl-ACP methyl ester carboxylesterase
VARQVGLADVRHPDYHGILRSFRRTTDWSDERPLSFPDENADLFQLSFQSANAHFLCGLPAYRCDEHHLDFAGEPTEQEPSDADVVENLRFRYPLLRGRGDRRPLDRVLLLLHGLNEHSYTKYMPWAYHLWARTRAGVILFPMTFHINRVLPEWLTQQQGSLARRKAIPGNENVHRFNAGISERLGTMPERFFWGAMQTFWDLIDLVKQIRAGRHAHVAPDARIDVMGYSAGGFIALALLLEDHEQLFSGSRGVVFASCAALRDTALSSHAIIDLMAEVALSKLYVKYREKLSNPRLRHWIDVHSEGRWLRAFSGLRPDRSALEPRLREIAPRLLAIANTNDHVIPSGAMLNALTGEARDIDVRVVELALGIHENPFACPDYGVRERQLVLDFLDTQRYGDPFERFIDGIAAHLAN